MYLLQDVDILLLKRKILCINRMQSRIAVFHHMKISPEFYQRACSVHT